MEPWPSTAHGLDKLNVNTRAILTIPIREILWRTIENLNLLHPRLGMLTFNNLSGAFNESRR